jgi:hypothetical protein
VEAVGEAELHSKIKDFCRVNIELLIRFRCGENIRFAACVLRTPKS